MKASFSISDELGQALGDYARDLAAGNASLIVEVALKCLLQMPHDEARQIVERHRIDRRAATRSGWMKAYWSVLGELMGQPDQNIYNSPYAPRRFGDFYAVLLLNHVDRQDDEDDPFIPHVGHQCVTTESPAPSQWVFDRSSSPVAAAEAVAAKLRECGVAIPA